MNNEMRRDKEDQSAGKRCGKKIKTICSKNFTLWKMLQLEILFFVTTSWIVDFLFYFDNTMCTRVPVFLKIYSFHNWLEIDGILGVIGIVYSLVKVCVTFPQGCCIQGLELLYLILRGLWIFAGSILYASLRFKCIDLNLYYAIYFLIFYFIVITLLIALMKKDKKGGEESARQNNYQKINEGYFFVELPQTHQRIKIDVNLYVVE